MGSGELGLASMPISDANVDGGSLTHSTTTPALASNIFKGSHISLRLW